MARPSARPLPSGCDPETRASRFFAEMLSAASPERRFRRRRRHAFESARLLFSQGAVRGIRHLRWSPPPPPPPVQRWNCGLPPSRHLF